jgi:hypothetical protein
MINDKISQNQRVIIVRIGLLEIIVILVIITVIVFITRIVRSERINKPVTAKRGENAGAQTGFIRRNYGPITGFILILISVILLWFGLRMLKWVVWSYTWFFILLSAGVVVLFLSRRRR